MQPAPSLPQANVEEARASGAAPEHPDDWTEELALIVAATVEPSCAFAFCFAMQSRFAMPRSPRRTDDR